MQSSILMGALCVAALAGTASAHQPLITDDTGTQGAGGNQFELALERSRTEQPGVASITRILPITVTRGISDSLDVFAGVSRLSTSSSAPAGDSSGAGNNLLGLKWRVYDSESGKTSLAIKPQYLFPVSPANEASGFGSGRASYGLTAILTQETPFGAIHANLFSGRTRYRDTTVNQHASPFHASVAATWNLGDAWKLALDLGTKAVRTAVSTVRADYVEIGAVFSPGKDCDLAVGFIRSTDNSPSNANALTAGLTWRFR